MFASRWHRWSRPCASRYARRWNFRPRVEALEDRALPSTVTTLLDDGSAGSLRTLIQTANPDGDTIDFAVTGTIQLTKGPLVVNSGNLTIDGPGAGQLTISAAGASGIFVVAAGSALSISGVTIANGAAAVGAGIDNFGLLTVESSTFAGNAAGSDGGAIDNESTGSIEVISGSSFVGNSAGAAGGALFNSGSVGSVVVNNSSFTANLAPNGASIFTSGGLSLFSDAFTENTPDNGMGGIAATDPTLLSFTNVLVTSGTSFTATAGVGFVDQVVAQFRDLESPKPPTNFSPPASPLSATIDWGDGTALDPGTTIISDGTSDGFLVLGSHTYAAEGTDTFSVTIKKGNGDISTIATAVGSAVVLTPSQSAQLVSSGIATGQPGNPTLTASASGITAVLTGAQGGPDLPSTLFVGTYAANPTNVSSRGLVFYDVRVTNTPNGSLLVSFLYPAGVANPQLLYFNPATNSFQPVQSQVLFNDTVHHVLIVVIDSSTTPTLASLDHTVFTIAVALPSPPNTATVAPALVSTGTTLAPTTTTTFTGNGQLTLTLTPLQQGAFALSQSGVDGGGGGGGMGDLDSSQSNWVWNLIPLDAIWQMLQPAIKSAMPAKPSSGSQDESDSDGPEASAADPAVYRPSFIRYWTETQGAREELPVPSDDSLESSQAARMAHLGLFFAGTALLQAEKRRPAA